MKKIYFIALLKIASISTMAQFSTPLGPPQAGPASIPMRTINFGFITRLAGLGIERAVNEINKQIDSASASSEIKAKLSFLIQSVHPAYLQTKSAATPNNNYVQLGLQVVYTISDIRFHGLPYFSRKVFQRINITAQCFQWQTEAGRSLIRYHAEKPILDEASFAEQALNVFMANTLLNFVNKSLSQALNNGISSGELPIESKPCNCLNFKAGTGPSFEDGYLGFYNMPTRKISIGALYSKPLIRLVSIKRMPTPALAPPLPETEDLQIEYMANFNKGVINSKAPIDNETVIFKDDISLSFDHPIQYGRLVIIANVSLDQIQMPVLSGFAEFEKNTNYGSGTHLLTILREVLTPASTGADGRPIKPQKMMVPAYEVMFEITYSKPKINIPNTE